MKIGKEVQIEGKTFSILRPLKEDGTHANAYLVTDREGTSFLLKKFLDKKRACGWLPYRSKRNHFGRVREASWRVFPELKAITLKYPFLVNHYSRDRYWYKKGEEWTWCWVIIQEFIEGENLGSYLFDGNFASSAEMRESLVLLGKALGEWHRNEIAHGDPHLYNAILQIQEDKPYKVRLVDYSQMHHPGFHYCRKCNCFSPTDRRLQEDFENTGSMGSGFINGIRDLEEKLKIRSGELQEYFWEGYHKEIPTKGKIES